MPDDQKNTESTSDEPRQKAVLKFLFTPADPPRPEEATTNPLSKRTTYVPEVVEALKAQFGNDVREVTLYAGEHTVIVATNRIVEVARYLHDRYRFTYLSDLGGIDRFTDDERFEVFYSLISMENKLRIRLKVRVDESNPVVPTLTDVFMAANWQEREAYDMFGIRFEGHPDLRRMFMPEDFEYHPLRKEFPLLGIPGSLPLPPQYPEGDLTMDPFAAAHGSKPVPSYKEPASDYPHENEEEQAR
jgi:NADH-quinone oxidoreductase subunit C